MLAPNSCPAAVDFTSAFLLVLGETDWGLARWTKLGGESRCPGVCSFEVSDTASSVTIGRARLAAVKPAIYYCAPTMAGNLELAIQEAHG